MPTCSVTMSFCIAAKIGLIELLNFFTITACILQLFFFQSRPKVESTAGLNPEGGTKKVTARMLHVYPYGL